MQMQNCMSQDTSDKKCDTKQRAGMPVISSHTMLLYLQNDEIIDNCYLYESM